MQFPNSFTPYSFENLPSKKGKKNKKCTHKCSIKLLTKCNKNCKTRISS